MIHPNKPAWQISLRHLCNLVFAVPLAAGAALIVWKLSFWRAIGPTVGLAFFLVTFVVFTVVLYFLFEWYWKTNTRLPPSGKELRQKRKEFFDNLP
jgi:hypothetical protein